MTTHNVRSLEDQRARGRIEAETWVAINTLVAEWVADAGRITERERALLEDAALCKLIVRRVIEHMSTRKTIFRNGKGGQLLPALDRIATFMNTARLNLLAVGLRPERANDNATACDRCKVTFYGPNVLRDYTQHREHCTAGSTPAAPTSVPHAEGSET